MKTINPHTYQKFRSGDSKFSSRLAAGVDQCVLVIAYIASKLSHIMGDYCSSLKKNVVLIFVTRDP